MLRGAPLSSVLVLLATSACSPFEANRGEVAADAGAPPSSPAPELVEAGAALLGAPEVGSHADAISTGFRDAYGYPVTRAGTGRRVWVYLPPDPARPTKGVVAGVYADRADVTPARPGKLLARGSRLDLRDGWNAFTLDAPVEAKAGQFLWIAVGPAEGVLRLRNVGSPGCARWQHTTAVIGADALELPDPWDSVADDDEQCQLSAFLTE